MAAEERGRVEDGVATHLAQVSWRPLVALTGSSDRLGPTYTVPCTHAPRAGLGRIRVCHGIRATLVDVSKMVGGSQVASRHAAPGGDFIISGQAPSDDAPRCPRTCSLSGNRRIKRRMANVVAGRHISGHDLAPTHHLRCIGRYHPSPMTSSDATRTDSSLVNSVESRG